LEIGDWRLKIFDLRFLNSCLYIKVRSRVSFFEEFNNLRSQFGTSRWGGSRYIPMVFTEQGVAMLSSVLNSSRAIAVNIRIIRVFTKTREMLTDNLNIKLEIEEIKKNLSNQNKNIELVFQYLDELIEKKEKPITKIGYKK